MAGYVRQYLLHAFFLCAIFYKGGAECNVINFSERGPVRPVRSGPGPAGAKHLLDHLDGIEAVQALPLALI